MAPKSLYERFSSNPPTRRPEDRHAWLASEEKRFILWGVKESRSAARIARDLGVNESTVRRFVANVFKDPRILLELDLFVMVGKAVHDEYKCLVCVERLYGRRNMERHMAGHFLDERLVEEFLPRPRGRPKGKSKGRRK